MSKVKQKIDFTGQTVFVGLDVHYRQWAVSISTETVQYRPFVSPPSSQSVAEYLREHFPNANFVCAYEAGFCGFVPHEQFKELGINCLVIHPADIPTSDKEAEFKRDSLDAHKICKSLRGGLLEGIHVPSKTQQLHRSIVRQRVQLRQDITRQRNRIKGLLKFYGIRIPEELDKPKWTEQLLCWLYSIELIDPIGTDTLRVALGQLVYLTGNRDYTNRRLKELSNTEPYIEDCDLLCSVPGIGRHTAIKFMVEIGDIARFKSLDRLCNYIGLVPASDSSGDKVRENRMTYRGNKELRTMLVESAWTSIGIDPALTLCYQNLKKRMIGQKAIIRIARKLLSRMRHVLLTREKYEHGIA